MDQPITGDLSTSYIPRSYKYRCYPADVQATRLNAWQIACWHVQRECIHLREIAWREGVKLLPNWVSQSRMITEARREFPYLADVPSDTMIDIVKRVEEAYQRFRRARQQGVAARAQRARNHTKIGLLFRGADRGTRIVAVQGRHAYWLLAGAMKLGPLKVRMSRSIPDGADIREAHISRAADGWYISFSCLVPAPAPLPSTEREVNGVDLGCIHEGDQQRVAVIDDGRIYRTTDNLKRAAKRLANLQRLVEPKRRVQGKAKSADPKSKRTQKRRRRIARLYQRVARQREHEMQYIARRVVDTANVSAFEDTDWKALRRKGRGRRKRGLNRALAAAAPGRLIELVKDKASLAGREVVKVSARYTSQQCHVCGERGEAKGLKVRQWTCVHCGTHHDRDVNAARNIAKRAVE